MAAIVGCHPFYPLLFRFDEVSTVLFSRTLACVRFRKPPPQELSGLTDRHAKMGFRFLVGQVTPERRALLLGMLLMLAQAAAALAVPALAGRFTDSILAGGYAGSILLLWLAIVTTQSALHFGNGYLLGRASAGILARMSERLYDHLQAMPLAWFHERSCGEVLALLTNDIQRLSAFVTGTLVGILPELVTFCGALALIYVIDPGLAIAVLFALPLFFLAVKLATRSLRPLARLLIHDQAFQVAIAEQNLALLPVIKSFVREAFESQRFRDQTRRVLSLTRKHLLLVQLISPAARILLTLGLVFLLWAVSARVASGTMAPGDLVSLLLYGMLMAGPLANLANLYGEIQTVRGSAQRGLDVFAVQPEPYQEGKPAMPKVRGEVRFEGVWFAYPGREVLLAGVDLHIEAGETLALIGAIDQNILLLNGTVAENIAYGCADASPAALERAAVTAHAHGFITELPAGYQTMIGDQGVKPSGG